MDDGWILIIRLYIFGSIYLCLYFLSDWEIIGRNKVRETDSKCGLLRGEKRHKGNSPWISQ